MAFLRLDHVRLPDRHIAVSALRSIPIGLSAASLEHAAELQAILPIGSGREGIQGKPQHPGAPLRGPTRRAAEASRGNHEAGAAENPELSARADSDMSLPYDMGNAGDLVKHGLLAEFTQWWCEYMSKPLCFLDPFAGRPWVSPPNPEVSRRVKALPSGVSGAIQRAQPDPDNRYYGSCYVVLNVAHALGCAAEVLFSDSDPNARQTFEGHDGFRELECNGFSKSDGFSILDSDCRGDLLLLDPFGNFLRDRASDVIPKVGKASARFACVLFVLNLNPKNPVGQRYGRLRADYLSAAWSLLCPNFLIVEWLASPDTRWRCSSLGNSYVIIQSAISFGSASMV
ncbi:MAG: hypothetical protein ACRD2N_18140 [Vicinamibacterales bacterium]